MSGYWMGGPLLQMGTTTVLPVVGTVTWSSQLSTFTGGPARAVPPASPNAVRSAANKPMIRVRIFTSGTLPAVARPCTGRSAGQRLQERCDQVVRFHVEAGGQFGELGPQ